LLTWNRFKIVWWNLPNFDWRSKKVLQLKLELSFWKADIIGWHGTGHNKKSSQFSPISAWQIFIEKSGQNRFLKNVIFLKIYFFAIYLLLLYFHTICKNIKIMKSLVNGIKLTNSQMNQVITVSSIFDYCFDWANEIIFNAAPKMISKMVKVEEKIYFCEKKNIFRDYPLTKPFLMKTYKRNLLHFIINILFSHQRWGSSSSWKLLLRRKGNFYQATIIIRHSLSKKQPWWNGCQKVRSKKNLKMVIY
jgi:hypothetical protein